LLLLRIATIVFVVTVARCSFIFHSCTDHKCLLHGSLKAVCSSRKN